jgi:hypothetical protein
VIQAGGVLLHESASVVLRHVPESLPREGKDALEASNMGIYIRLTNAWDVSIFVFCEEEVDSRLIAQSLSTVTFRYILERIWPSGTYATPMR